MKNSKKYMLCSIILCSSTILCGCEKNTNEKELSCTSIDVKNLYSKQLYGVDYNDLSSPNIGLYLDKIITQKQYDNELNCRAHVSYADDSSEQFRLYKEQINNLKFLSTSVNNGIKVPFLKEFIDRKGGDHDLSIIFSAMEGNYTKPYEVRYTVLRTDDKKDIFIENTTDIPNYISKYAKEEYFLSSNMQEILQNESKLKLEYQGFLPGDTLTFGSYKQNNINAAEPIVWRVLDAKDGKLLLVSEKLLDTNMYGNVKGYLSFDQNPIIWKYSTINSWLNGYFLRTAFSEKEINKIEPTIIKTPNQPESTDRIFLLSAEEVEKYFSDAYSRTADATQYSINNGGYYYNKSGVWWLRSKTYNDRNYAVVVNSRGIISDFNDSSDKNVMIRPAFWYNPNATKTESNTSISLNNQNSVTNNYPNIKPGSIIKFGLYPQGKLGEKNKIAWIVLSTEDNKTLLLSYKILDAVDDKIIKDNISEDNITWENRSLREWLNTKFIDSAFNDSEKQALVEVELDNHDEELSGSLFYGDLITDEADFIVKGGNKTKDRAFLLDLHEVEKYIPNDRARIAVPTDYAKSRNAFVCDIEEGSSTNYENITSFCQGVNATKTSPWLLRSPGCKEDIVSFVDVSGDISRGGVSCYYGNGNDFANVTNSIRVSLWVDLSKLENIELVNEKDYDTNYNPSDYGISKNSVNNTESKADKPVSIDPRKGRYATDDYYASLDKYKIDANSLDDALKKLLELARYDDTGIPEYLIAKIYHNGTYGSKDVEKAMYYYGLSEKKDNGLAMFRLGLLLKANHQEDTALEYINNSVGKSVPVAVNYLGYMYEIGIIVVQDYNKARLLYEQSRYLGNSSGAYALANLYLNGLGVAKNIKQGCLYLSEAKDTGNPKANSLFNERCESEKVK